MALNAASHNISTAIPIRATHSAVENKALTRADLATAGEKTGPVSGQPPSVSAEVTNDILASANKDPKGTSAIGQDGGDSEAPKKAKSEKECMHL